MFTLTRKQEDLKDSVNALSQVALIHEGNSELRSIHEGG
jgi:hypothetical protein